MSSRLSVLGEGLDRGLTIICSHHMVIGTLEPFRPDWFYSATRCLCLMGFETEVELD